MYITRRNSDIIQDIRQKFLTLNADGAVINLSKFHKKCVIYVIENLTNHKIYIGKTMNLMNRANHYIHQYRQSLYTGNRAIILAIREEGIENFRMYPIYISQDRYEMAKDERRFIEFYQATNSEKGYNDVLPSGIEQFHKDYASHPHSIQTKILKSKWIVCINPDSKQMYVCTGMKLFGDVVGSSKDQVKNCTRRGIRHRGYYVIYTATEDRKEIADKRREEQQIYLEWKHKTHPNYNRDKFEEYLYFVDLVDMMMNDWSVDSFKEAGYNCNYITYNTNPKATKPYKIEAIEKFLVALRCE